MPIELETGSAEDTRAVGAAIAGLLEPRDTLILTGDLGAGKTTLVQGIGRGLGAPEHVASPTFTLVREYSGRLDVAHVDVYRLERLQDVVDLGLDELGSPDRVLVVEWGDAIEELLSPDLLRIELRTADVGETRRIEISAYGASWASRWERLEQALRRWAAGAHGGDRGPRQEAAP
jgi:tRNA threonylcarbamoyladenosine biosynthesis protein TsaE